MKKLFFLLLLFPVFLSAQTVDELFVNANNLYKEGQYEKAIELYKKIETTKKVSSELYYNLANCYYKLNQVAPSIYNYEKALQLNPLNADAQNNLAFAKRLTLDRIEEVPKSFLQKIHEKYIQKLTYNQWAIVAVVFSFMAALLFLLFYFTNTPNKKRLFFVSSILSFLFLLVSLTISYNEYHNSKTNKFAIIFNQQVSIKNAPTLNSNEVFILHEGAKVKVLDTVDDWKKIKLADGKIGWVKASEIKIIS
ncbi:tetratricopeptide repeat protein [Tenacibaculum sp. UWU-22]|uniref:SH3 domain-containing protein n=1 Tax=Tenacibaculum sp. UWU-22 TaxID=3234187 RepID=UPI0034DAE440